MKQELKQPWIDALRSGNYKQGKYCLVNNKNSTYCCLGVLCTLNNYKDLMAEDHELTFNFIDVMANSEFYDRTGLSCSSTSKLADMNDGGRSFNEIADYIEANL